MGGFAILIVLVFNLVLTYSVYTMLNDKGYTKGCSITLAVLTLWGGLIIFIIICCLPEVSDHSS